MWVGLRTTRCPAALTDVPAGTRLRRWSLAIPRTAVRLESQRTGRWMVLRSDWRVKAPQPALGRPAGRPLGNRPPMTLCFSGPQVVRDRRTWPVLSGSELNLHPVEVVG